MSLNETYNKLNKELQQNVKIEIEKAEKGKSKKSLSQLQLILSELEKSYDTPNVNLSFPRLIVDSWDYSDELGIKLINLADKYKRIKWKTI